MMLNESHRWLWKIIPKCSSEEYWAMDESLTQSINRRNLKNKLECNLFIVSPG